MRCMLLNTRGEKISSIRLFHSLDCLWNDVIHTTAVHPQEMKDEMINAGLTRLKDERQKYYKIPVEILDPQRTAVCLYKEEFGENVSLDFKNFVWFDSDDMDAYSDLPEATKNFYKQCRAERRKFRSFVYVPHILYQGELDVSECEIIEV